MEKRITIDLGDTSADRSDIISRADRLDNTLAKLKAQEEKFMRMAQQMVPPSNGIKLDTSVSPRLIAEYKPDSIFPENYFENLTNYSGKRLKSVL